MIVSPFTPLFFNDHRKTDGIDSEYMQTFATTDRILLEVISDSSEEILAGVNRWITDDGVQSKYNSISFNRWQINDHTYLFFAEICLNPGTYQVRIENRYGPGVPSTSEPFQVTDDAHVLSGTTLIQYSMRNNRQRKDAAFFIAGMQYFFDFRVPGGFKDRNWQFGVDSEQFVTDESDIVQLYGLESTQKRFTLGHSQGCPVWFGEMLNRILVCDHVYFDGEKYSRKESGVPEIAQPLAGVNSFIFTQTVQQSFNLDPTIEQRNQAIMRRVDAADFRVINSTTNRIIH